MVHISARKDSEEYPPQRNPIASAIPLGLEKELLSGLLDPRPGDSILVIGCGAEEILEYCLSLKLDTTGADSSRTVLDHVPEHITSHTSLHICHAEDLPFGDNSFNYACFFLSLEFVKDPEKALAEAFRVAKDKVFIGIANPHALKYLVFRMQALWGRSSCAKVQFFSLSKIKGMTRKLLGDVPVSWRSVGFLPKGIPGSRFLDRWSLAQKLPLGAFIGISVILVPRFRLIPLALSASEKESRQQKLAGLAVESTENTRCNQISK